MIKFAIVAHIIDLALVIMIIFVAGFQDKALLLVLSVGMVFVCSAWIMFALLFVILPGGCDKDDYIFGALLLYLEIARLFFYLMRLFGERK